MKQTILASLIAGLFVILAGPKQADAGSPYNPCAVKKSNPCNPCNPCAGKKNTHIRSSKITNYA